MKTKRREKNSKRKKKRSFSVLPISNASILSFLKGFVMLSFAGMMSDFWSTFPLFTHVLWFLCLFLTSLFPSMPPAPAQFQIHGRGSPTFNREALFLSKGLEYYHVLLHWLNTCQEHCSQMSVDWAARWHSTREVAMGPIDSIIGVCQQMLKFRGK